MLAASRLMLIGALLLGCGESRKAEPSTQPSSEQAGPTAPWAPPPSLGARAAAAEVAEAVSDDPGSLADDSSPIGVGECDQYLGKLEACLTKDSSPENQAAMRDAFRAQRAAWRQSAHAAEGNPQVASELAKNCREAAVAARVTMQRYGCDW